MGSISDPSQSESVQCDTGMCSQAFTQLRGLTNKAIENSPLLQTGVTASKDLYARLASTKAGARVTQLVSGLQAKGVLVPETWFAAVDGIVANGKATIKAGGDKVHNVEAALMAFAEQFLALHARVRQEDAAIDKHEYIARVRHALNTVWNESLREPVSAFYARASEKLPALKKLNGETLSAHKLLDSVRAELGTAWVDASSKAMNLAARPSHAIYNAAVQAYTTGVKAGSQLQLRQHEFVQSVRQQLGDKWTERLEAPLVEFFQAARQKSVTELRAIHAVLDTDGDGTVTVGDAVTTITQLGTLASSKLLRTTQSAMDRVLPTGAEAAQADAAEPTLGHVAGDLSKRLETRIKPAAEKASGTLRRFGLAKVDTALRFLLAFFITLVTSPLVRTTAQGVRERAESVLGRASAWLETMKPRPLVSLPRDFFLYILTTLQAYVRVPGAAAGQAASPSKPKRVILASVAEPQLNGHPVVAEPASQAQAQSQAAQEPQAEAQAEVQAELPVVEASSPMASEDDKPLTSPAAQGGKKQSQTRNRNKGSTPRRR